MEKLHGLEQENVSSAETTLPHRSDPSDAISQASSYAARNAPTLKRIAAIRFQRILYSNGWETPMFGAILVEQCFSFQSRHIMHHIIKDEYAQDDQRFVDFMANVYLYYWPGSQRISSLLKKKMMKINKPKYKAQFPRLSLPSEFIPDLNSDKPHIQRLHPIPITSTFFAKAALHKR